MHTSLIQPSCNWSESDTIGI
uniref:Uncharacterized protein n=1 Tax=Anguilla anguilla TaxID=7936 RepID=A0A0E9W6U2_ANGAN